VVRAQDSLSLPMPPSPASVTGHVVIPGPTSETPVRGVMVTLHRVGRDSAGPLDSVRTDGAGRFTIRYQRFGSDAALYFAAAVYHGIAYFTAPLRAGRVAGDDAEIAVFDTTSRPVPLTIQGHHIVVSAAQPDGRRDVVEVYELSNDTTATLVGRDTLTPVWSAAVPAGALDFAGGQGDVAAAAHAPRGAPLEQVAPFGPGVKQLSFSYALPEKAFPLHLTLERQTGVLEVLLEEAGAQARGSSLRSQGTATTQGRTFKRFLAQGAPAGETLRIDVPSAAAGTRSRVLIGLAIAIVLAMAAALLRALRRSPRADAVPGSLEGASDESLIAEIAALDVRHDAGDATLTEADYLAQRAALKARARAVARVIVCVLAGGSLAVGAACGRSAPAAHSPATDDFGDSIAVAPPPRRIVSLNPTTTELLYAIGAGARVVGRTTYDYYPPQVRAVADLGPGLRPNVEAVLAIRPDLVILYASEDNRDAARRLRASGIRTVAYRVDRIVDFARVTLALGRLTGDSAAARVTVDTVQTTLDRVRAQTRALPHPTAFWILWESPLLSVGGGSFLNELLEVAGARNVYDSLPAPSPAVSFEDLLRRDPDVVLASPVTRGRLLADPRWRALRAVREGRVLVFDTTIVNGPSARIGASAGALARLLHPAELR
jgi:ABC-type Fe3+-hydroxamate transport system substrate-binding protein